MIGYSSNNKWLSHGDNLSMALSPVPVRLIGIAASTLVGSGIAAARGKNKGKSGKELALTTAKGAAAGLAIGLGVVYASDTISRVAKDRALWREAMTASHLR